KKYMALTPTCYNAKDIENLGLDYIVVGSDEVSNYQETKGNAKVKFVVGLEKEKQVAYAPSVGQTHETDVPE
ncbi:polysaccharide pyruvyl transferase family protein, partial [Coprococcus eutactus]|nr:polysaccharide pyruvyl transferase family protein [Coprococcus eutactus]